jgi:hypothetical protein
VLSASAAPGGKAQRHTTIVSRRMIREIPFGFAGNGSSRSALPPSLILIFRAFSKLRCSGVCYCCFGAAGGLAAGAVSPGVVFLVLVLVLAFFLGVVGSAAGA